jgi:DNA-binding LytR/AlgR family response regulator
MRCHRSFIVNKQKIMSVEGNSSGYNIVLNGYSHKIPLSKKYKEALRSENK